MSTVIVDHVRLRPAMDGDFNFVYSSWLKSYRQSEATKPFSDEIYFEGQRKLITQILMHSKVVVAVSVDDPSHIYGWVCFEPHSPFPVLHYVYVKHVYRTFGVGRMLLGEMLEGPVVYSHDDAFKSRLSQGSYFNPYKSLGGV